MRITEMTTNECRRVLNGISLGRLGCSREDQPYVVPVYFAYEPGLLYGFATNGQKIEWMRTNPKVCVEVDEITNQFNWECVVITGSFEELGSPRHAAERQHARELLQNRSLWWETAFAARRLESESDLIAPIFFRVQIESITGHRAVANPDERASNAAAISLSSAK